MSDKNNSLTNIGLAVPQAEHKHVAENEDVKTMVEDYTTSFRTNGINQQYYLNLETALSKNLEANDRDIVNIEVK